MIKFFGHLCALRFCSEPDSEIKVEDSALRKGLKFYKKSTIILILFGGLLVLGIPHKAQAIPVTGTFTGAVNQVAGPDDLQKKIGVGTPFTGYFFYDTNSPSIFYEDNWEVYSGSDYNIFLEIVCTDEVFALSSPLSGICISNSEETDSFELPFIMGWTGLIAGYEPEEGSLNLCDSTGTIFNNTSLPATFNIDDFDAGILWIANYGDPNAGFEISSSIETLTVHPVPEPTTIILSGFALLGLAGLRYKLGKR